MRRLILAVVASGLFVILGVLITQKINPLGPPRACTVTYEGRTAQYWGPLLQDRDPVVSQDAMRALTAIGEEGAYWILQAMGSDNELTQARAANLCNVQMIEKYKSSFTPAVIRLIKSGCPEARGRAIDLARDSQMKKAIPALEEYSASLPKESRTGIKTVIDLLKAAD